MTARAAERVRELVTQANDPQKTIEARHGAALSACQMSTTKELTHE